MESARCVVVVDPYSSGAMLADALRARGAACVAVESSLSLPKRMKSRFDPGGFVDVIQHDRNFSATLTAVEQHRPTHVAAGFESGVELAERLGEALSLPCNVPALRAARRDKFLMGETVSACGLRTPRQLQADRWTDVAAWVNDHAKWPVIVKPTRSVASDCVFRCDGLAEVRRAVEAILGQTNVLGETNQSVLVQEFISGQEFAVDTVSHDGQPKLTALWQYHRPPDSRRFVCYDSMTLLPYEGKLQQALREFVFQVLSALGITFGPAHCELMWVDQEPVLIEVGSRLTAGNNATLSRTCGGICQLDETVEAILAPERFHATSHRPPGLGKQAANVFLRPSRPGRLHRTRGLGEIRRLSTLHSLSVAEQPGTELGHVAGLVTLLHEDLEAIERDMRRIQALEAEGIFILEDSHDDDIG